MSETAPKVQFTTSPAVRVIVLGEADPANRSIPTYYADDGIVDRFWQFIQDEKIDQICLYSHDEAERFANWGGFDGFFAPVDIPKIEAWLAKNGVQRTDQL